MPWGTWITCEETINGPDVGPDFTGVTQHRRSLKPHGFIFEVPVDGQSNRASRSRRRGASPTRRRPTTRAAASLYMTEDNFAFPSGFYRYLPPSNPMVDGHLEDGGQLQMLKVVGCRTPTSPRRRPAGDVRRRVGRHRRAGSELRVHARACTAPTTNDEAINFVGSQGRAHGAAQFSRLEGAVYDQGRHLLHLDAGRRRRRDGGPELDAHG